MIPKHRQPKGVRGKRVVVIEADIVEAVGPGRGEEYVEKRAEFPRLEAAMADPIADALHQRTKIISEILVQRDACLGKGQLKGACAVADVISDAMSGDAAFAGANEIEEKFVGPIE